MRSFKYGRIGFEMGRDREQFLLEIFIKRKPIQCHQIIIFRKMKWFFD